MLMAKLSEVTEAKLVFTLIAFAIIGTCAVVQKNVTDQGTLLIIRRLLWEWSPLIICTSHRGFMYRGEYRHARYEDDGTMPEELSPIAKAAIDQARVENAKGLLEQKRAEQKQIDPKNPDKKGTKSIQPPDPAPTKPKESDPKEIQPAAPEEIPHTEAPKPQYPARDQVRMPGKKPYIDFLRPLLDKRVSVDMVNGAHVEGVLKAFNNYEIKIELGSHRMILMKHAIVFIDILEPVVPPAPTTPEPPTQPSDETAPAQNSPE